MAQWRKEAYAGPEWVLMSERLPERGQVVDLYDAMNNQIDRHTVTWEPDHTDGDYVMWRPVPQSRDFIEITPLY